MRNRTADASKYPKTPVLRYEDDVAILPNEYFDEIVYRLDNCGYRVGELDGWYPTMRQAEELAKNAVDHYEFIFWITESNYELAQKHSDVQNYLINALKKCARFVDAPKANARRKSRM